MYFVNIFLGCLVFTRAVTITVIAEPVDSVVTTTARNNETTKTLGARRILSGRHTGETRPYMVYLRPASTVDPKISNTNWICGGVIIHELYILTSAACIEDAKHFYVVSGTHKWLPSSEKNECIENGAKKAVWKCVPKSYHFDGNEFDNIRWMAGDIAVVKVEERFNFERKIRGCDFVPKKISYNNRSADMEKGGTVGTIAGWGTTDVFEDVLSTKRAKNSPELLDTEVRLVSKKACKKRWAERYHYIIEDHMICTKDMIEDSMSAACLEREVNCKELVYSEEDEEKEEDEMRLRRMIVDPDHLEVHTAAHDSPRRTMGRGPAGGFCENDHGGPLIVGQGKSSVVVGVMSACLTKEVTHKCYGPFLYTSVYNYRNLIACAIEKEPALTCRALLRSSKSPIIETTFDWSTHIDGPPKSEGVPEIDRTTSQGIKKEKGSFIG